MMGWCKQGYGSRDGELGRRCICCSGLHGLLQRPNNRGGTIYLDVLC